MDSQRFNDVLARIAAQMHHPPPYRGPDRLSTLPTEILEAIIKEILEEDALSITEPPNVAKTTLLALRRTNHEVYRKSSAAFGRFFFKTLMRKPHWRTVNHKYMDGIEKIASNPDWRTAVKSLQWTLMHVDPLLFAQHGIMKAPIGDYDQPTCVLETYLNKAIPRLPALAEVTINSCCDYDMPCAERWSGHPYIREKFKEIHPSEALRGAVAILRPILTFGRGSQISKLVLEDPAKSTFGVSVRLFLHTEAMRGDLTGLRTLRVALTTECVEDYGSRTIDEAIDAFVRVVSAAASLTELKISFLFRHVGVVAWIKTKLERKSSRLLHALSETLQASKLRSLELANAFIDTDDLTKLLKTHASTIEYLRFGRINLLTGLWSSVLGFVEANLSALSEFEAAELLQGQRLIRFIGHAYPFSLDQERGLRDEEDIDLSAVSAVIWSSDMRHAHASSKFTEDCPDWVMVSLQKHPRGFRLRKEYGDDIGWVLKGLAGRIQVDVRDAPEYGW
ncbi:hypothetical protein BU16DRAFT_539397 [Lophium mytilinum]|uniref:Uncharacterized protein n=1 Tax=Lophium mytilinum TaxID=390894 RepID=A0A6A6QSP9_9PEZI|nr:hypothetical protein BU16DRAFT_539397 [Lophium mytilinum]